jgi:hypothetical protein
MPTKKLKSGPDTSAGNAQAAAAYATISADAPRLTNAKVVSAYPRVVVYKVKSKKRRRKIHGGP